MRKISTLIVATLLTGSLQAQTYTSESFSNPTFPSLIIGEVDHVDLNGMIGVGQTWNLITEDVYSSLDVNVIPVAEGAGNEAFPDANFALSITGGVLYMEYSTTSLEELGFYLEQGGTGYAQAYTNPKLYFNMPLSYGDSGSDTYEGEFAMEGGLYQIIEGTTSWEVVGTGTIITNGGTFENALMVETYEEQIQTMEIAGMTFTTTIVIEGFDFLVEGIPFSVASMETWTATSDGGTESGVNAYSLEALPMSVEQLPLLEVEVYPNPTQNTIIIDLANTTETFTFNILNTTGQLVKTDIISGQRTVVDLSDLPEGVYLVSGSTSRGVMRERVVVRR